MALSYDLYVRHEISRTLRGISRSRRDHILRFIAALASDPFQSGDFSEPDRTGRICHVKIIGRFAVYFWADHPVKEIKVVDLIDADRK